MMDWIQVISYLFTNELRLFFGLYLVARLTDFSLKRKALLVLGISGCLADHSASNVVTLHWRNGC